MLPNSTSPRCTPMLFGVPRAAPRRWWPEVTCRCRPVCEVQARGIEPTRAHARTGIVDRPSRADEVWDTKRKKCLRQSGELFSCLLLVGDRGRKTGVGKDQARHLTHAENFFGRQEAIRSENPPGLVRRLVEKRVSSIVDHVILLIDDQHRELERIARLDALHPAAAAAQSL